MITPYGLYLIYHETIHFLFALPLIFLVLRNYGRKAVWLVLLVTFLIDVDHLFDLLLGGATNLIERLTYGDIFFGIEKRYLFFHSFELVAFFFIFGRIFKKRRWFFYPFALALFYHILVDIVSYFEKGIMPWEYFLILRFVNNFRL